RMDVDQALVRAHLEVLPRVLVLERAPDHAVDVLLGGQGHGPGDGRAGTGRVLDDRRRRLVQGLVVVALEADADLLLSHSGRPTSRLLCFSSSSQDAERLLVGICYDARADSVSAPAHSRSQ